MSVRFELILLLNLHYCRFTRPATLRIIISGLLMCVSLDGVLGTESQHISSVSQVVDGNEDENRFGCMCACMHEYVQGQNADFSCPYEAKQVWIA